MSYCPVKKISKRMTPILQSKSAVNRINYTG